MTKSAWPLLSALAACSPSHDLPDANAGLPIADPGGPFVTTVPPDSPLAGLDLIDGDTLCRDLATAYYSFLDGAFEQETLCRRSAVETSTEIFELDAGPEGFDAAPGLCASLYGTCIQSDPASSVFFCPLPAPPDMPCSATVSDLSACLNEIASFDPVNTCVMVPACDGGLSDAAAPSPSSLPACERLMQICPIATQIAHFPC